MKITWLGQSGYLIEAGGRRLVIDPYLSDSLAISKGVPRLAPPPLSIAELLPAAVFITHDHLDHFDPDTLGPLLRCWPDCLLAGPRSVLEHGRCLGTPECRMVAVSVENTMTLVGFGIRPTPAKHSDPCAVGLVIESDGEAAYISGDTLFDAGIAARISSIAGRTLDAAFVCINGRKGNMNATEAAEFVAAFRPTIAVPMHYGMFAANTADPRMFVAACREHGQETRVLELGETIQLSKEQSETNDLVCATGESS
jgi:L-ascorbate 6-phosphate lactonase